MIWKVLNGCVSCRKRQAPPAEQKMASLPPVRITPEKPPFSFTGVDCFGLFEVRCGRTRAVWCYLYVPDHSSYSYRSSEFVGYWIVDKRFAEIHRETRPTWSNALGQRR
jgi:hypothetical protein